MFNISNKYNFLIQDRRTETCNKYVILLNFKKATFHSCCRNSSNGINIDRIIWEIINTNPVYSFQTISCYICFFFYYLAHIRNTHRILAFF